MQFLKSDSAAHHDVPLLGIFYAVSAHLMLAVMNMLAKILSEHHHVIEIAFFRNAVSMLIFLGFILGTRKFYLFRTKTPVALGMRAFLGTVSLVCTFAAFSVLSMAEATVLTFLAPLILPALGFFVLGEKVGVRRWVAIVTGFFGVLFIAGLNGFTGPLWGIILAIAAAFMYACLGLLLRYMKRESSITITFYFVFLGSLMTGVFMPFVGTGPQNFLDFGLLLGIGVVGTGAQLCLALAIKNAPVSITSPMAYTGLLWATCLDVLMWHMIPGWPVFLGATIIIASNLYIILREHILQKGKVVP